MSEFSDILDANGGLWDVEFAAEMGVWMDAAVATARDAHKLFEACGVPFHPATWLFMQISQGYMVAYEEHDGEGRGWSFDNFWDCIRASGQFDEAVERIVREAD